MDIYIYITKMCCPTNKHSKYVLFRENAMKVFPKSCGTSFLPLCSAPLCIEWKFCLYLISALTQHVFIIGVGSQSADQSECSQGPVQYQSSHHRSHHDAGHQRSSRWPFTLRAENRRSRHSETLQVIHTFTQMRSLDLNQRVFYRGLCFWLPVWTRIRKSIWSKWLRNSWKTKAR